MNELLLTNWLESRSKSTPNNTAIIYEAQYLTYNQLLRLAKGYAFAIQEFMSANNIETYTKIAILLPNRPISIAILHGITLIGKEIVLLNTRLSNKEIQWQIEYLNVDLLVITKQFGNILRSDKLDIPIVDIGSPEFSDNASSNEIPAIAAINQNAVCCYIFTSGTTGRPKAVPLTFANIFYSAVASSFRLGNEQNDQWLLAMPIYHLGGLSIIYRSCLYGSSIVLHERFDELQIIRSIENHSITFISLVPAMLKRLLPFFQERNIDHSLKVVLIGGGFANEKLVTSSINTGLPIALTYGLTESSSQFCTANPEQTKRKPRSVGKPLLFSKLKILNEDKDGIGEIWISGPTVMKGYLKPTTAQNESLQAGYFNTGDLGYLDEDGDLYIVQRRLDLIISGGENVYPAEIEGILNQYPEVDQAVVVGIPDEQWGQVPIAMIKWKSSDVTVEKKHLVERLQGSLASYKIPRKYFQISELPKTSSGKVIRSILKEYKSMPDIIEIE